MSEPGYFINSAGKFVKKTCKNCLLCIPSYKTYKCGRTGKRTRLTDSCENWREK